MTNKKQRRIPTIDEISGCDPDFTGGQSTEEYMADMRGSSTAGLRQRIAALEAENERLQAECRRLSVENIALNTANGHLHDGLEYTEAERDTARRAATTFYRYLVVRMHMQSHSNSNCERCKLGEDCGIADSLQHQSDRVFAEAMQAAREYMP